VSFGFIAKPRHSPRLSHRLLPQIVARDFTAMKKSERMQAIVAGEPEPPGGWHPCYAGYFQRFNAGEYYEAHDVLEHLWLRTTGPDYGFFKGLIQLAGAFVHLQKHHARPHHPKDGRRLHPAARLFQLARTNLAPHAPARMGLDVAAVCTMAGEWIAAIERGQFQHNPWTPHTLPSLTPHAH
jgi:hypothetical protein